MSRRQEPIQTKSYLSLPPNGESKLCLEDLDGGQKDYLGALLHAAFLNALYAGQARFRIEDPSP
ncbi:MAG: hypothetical protein FWE12_06415 [Oscillospiraceae bacterium]|nr:hypothetical protein [Oscillospiraceae bacterium]